MNSKSLVQMTGGERHAHLYGVLPVSSGDILSLEKETSRGYIVKKNGVSGWYLGELEKV